MKFFINSLLIASATCAISYGEKTTLRVITEDFPPLNYSVNGEIKGISTAIVKKVLEKADIQYTLELLPWARGYEMTQNEPNTMIYSIYRTQARESLFHFSGPLLETYAEFVVLAENKDNIKITSLESAKTLKIGTMNKAVEEQFLLEKGFEKGKNIESSVDFTTAFKKLLDKRVDAIYYPIDSSIATLKSMGEDPNKIASAYRLSREERGPEFVCMGMSKSKNSTEIPEKLQKAFDELKAAGEIDKIIQEERQNFINQ